MKSDPEMLANSPPWLADLLSRFDETLRAAAEREKERSDQVHRGMSRMSAATLKLEANIELTRQEVLGSRADFTRVERLLGEMEARIWDKITDVEEQMGSRVSAVAARVTAVEERVTAIEMARAQR
jgi:hypothetical protein